MPIKALGRRGRDLLEPGRVVSSWVMASSGLKQKMVETVEHLPESATVEDAIERLYFLAKVERGLEQSAAGDTIAHEDIKKRFLG
jgi:predicted transcriptional regulator